MNRLSVSYIINVVAARNKRFGCMPCRWVSAVGIDGLGEGLEHAALHENESAAAMFREAVSVIRRAAEAGRDYDNMALLLSRVGEDGWNCMVLDQMESFGVLVRVRGMG